MLYREVDAYPDSFFYGRLANAYVQISDFSKAGESFRNMTRLEDPRHGENLSHDISINPHFTVSYIEFLANQGREADAKAVYYALLRYHSVPSPSPDMGKEPFPFLIVFDQDEYGDYWEYTPERVILAAKLATMRKMECYFFDYYTYTNRQHPELMEQAKSTFAGWYYPYAVDAIKDPLEIDETKVSQALSLAKSQKELEWINHGVEFVQASLLDRQDPNFIHINDGRAERRKMPILESSRTALMKNFDSVSCGKWGSKF